MSKLKLTFITAVFTLVFSNAAFAQKQKTTESAIIKTSIMCDHCKACETCGVEQRLLKVNGVQMATLDMEANTMKVVYNTKKTNMDTIRQAISRMGFDADDVKADVAAYEALDGCCKK